MEEISAAIGKIFMAMIALILLTLLRGLILSKFWLWFIVTTFNVEPLRIVEAIGLSFVVGFITDSGFKKTNLDDEKPIVRVLTIAGAYFLMWGLGWIWYQFI